MRAVVFAACFAFLVSCVFLVSCGKGGEEDAAIDPLASACENTTNLGPRMCKCVAELAAKELSPEGVEFLAASMNSDQNRTTELVKEMGVEKAMAAGMFMTQAPSKCAKKAGAE